MCRVHKIFSKGLSRYSLGRTNNTRTCQAGALPSSQKCIHKPTLLSNTRSNHYSFQAWIHVDQSRNYSSSYARAKPVAAASSVETLKRKNVVTCAHRATRVHTTESGPSENLRKRVSNRSCLLTGATSGIGYAVLVRLLAEGASHLRLITRDAERGQKAAARAREETRSNCKVDVLVHDLESESGLTRQLFEGSENWPMVDTLIHCAGISQTTLAMSTPSDTRRRILKINTETYMELLSLFLRQYSATLRKAKEHHNVKRSSFCAVGVSSLLALKGGVGTSTYAASKAAMIAFNRSVSFEAGHMAQRQAPTAAKFRVNTVVPGYIDTPMVQDFTEEHRVDLEHKVPLGRFGTSEEVADAVLFVVANEYANNCVLNLDGGLSAT